MRSDDLEERTYRELVSRPHFGHVKGVETEDSRIGFLRLHDLHLGRPLNLLARLNALPELTL
jgi:hypothetical protein